MSGRFSLHIFYVGSVTAQQYEEEVLEPHVRLFKGAIGRDFFFFMDNNTRPHRANPVKYFLEEEDICQREWPLKSPDLNPIKHAWDAIGRAIAGLSKHRPDVKISTYRREELLPQDEINNLICSMRVHCEACIDARGGHIPY
ncbi:DDE_3 domain-containing protein [Trichonephila clavipes]|nr:DDE_3 domain-containing protein [Trichonephila clavipes]